MYKESPEQMGDHSCDTRKQSILNEPVFTLAPTKNDLCAPLRFPALATSLPFEFSETEKPGRSCKIDPKAVEPFIPTATLFATLMFTSALPVFELTKIGMCFPAGERKFD